MNIDTDKIDETVLALLSLTIHSVVMTPEGVAKSRELFDKLYAKRA